MATKRLFKDENFHNGFTLLATKHGAGGSYVGIDEIKFPMSVEKPQWFLAQWHSNHCLKKERFSSDGYTVENIAKKVRYIPEEDCISLTLRGKEEYLGKPHINPAVLWPHLLIEQIPYNKFEEIPEDEKIFYACNMKKLSVEMDIRMPDYKGTDITEGILACQFMAYFYITLKDGSGFIYLGINLFDSRGLMETYWAPDIDGHTMIYLLSTVGTFGSRENSFNSSENIVANNVWHYVNVDLTPHLEEIIARANEQNTFGKKITKDDLFIRGTNIGFETHGNIDCTFDFRNFNLISEI